MFDSPHSQRVFERLLNSEQAAAIVKIHPKTLQRYARTGIVSGVRVGEVARGGVEHGVHDGGERVREQLGHGGVSPLQRAART